MSSKNVIQESVYHCRTTLALKTFCYTWNIDDFREVYKYATEVYSTTVETYFRFYLSMEKDNLKLFMLINENKSYTSGSYSIFFKTKENIVSTNNKYVSKSIHKLYNEELLCELPTSDIQKYLCNETFTIHFKFRIFHDLINHDISHAHCPTKFLRSNIIRDDLYVTFVINKRSLQINKSLLCANSKIFEVMLYSGLKNEVDKIEITDISYDTLKELIAFLKYGHLSDKIKTDAEALYKLYLAADRYEIKNLKPVCEKYLIMNTTIDNVVEHLELCLNDKQLLHKYAIQFIQMYIKEIKNNPEYKLLMRTRPNLLTHVENDVINISKATV